MSKESVHGLLFWGALLVGWALLLGGHGIWNWVGCCVLLGTAFLDFESDDDEWDDDYWDEDECPSGCGLSAFELCDYRCVVDSERQGPVDMKKRLS